MKGRGATDSGVERCWRPSALLTGQLRWAHAHTLSLPSEHLPANLPSCSFRPLLPSPPPRPSCPSAHAACSGPTCTRPRQGSCRAPAPAVLQRGRAPRVLVAQQRPGPVQVVHVQPVVVDGQCGEQVLDCVVPAARHEQRIPRLLRVRAAADDRTAWRGTRAALAPGSARVLAAAARQLPLDHAGPHNPPCLRPHRPCLHPQRTRSAPTSTASAPALHPACHHPPGCTQPAGCAPAAARGKRPHPVRLPLARPHNRGSPAASPPASQGQSKAPWHGRGGQTAGGCARAAVAATCSSTRR
jgi:hypothetical protein